MSQLKNGEVNSGNCNALLASNYASRICGRHAAFAGMKCGLKGIKYCSHCVWLAQES